MYRTFLAAAVMSLSGLAQGTTAATSPASAPATTEVVEFDSADINKLVIKNNIGDVKVNVSQGGKAIVTITKKNFTPACRVNVLKKEQSLHVEIAISDPESSCDANYDIKIPKEIAIDAESGSGDLQINDTKGELSFDTGHGDIKVNAEVTNLDGKSGHGDISINGLTASGSLKSGSGDITITYKAAPTSGELNIKSGSGDAQVVLPKDAKVKTSFRAGNGSLKNDLGETADSKFKISMDSGSGDLMIKAQD